MRSPFAAGLGPLGRTALVVLGAVAALKALALVVIADGVAAAIAALASGADARTGLVTGAAGVVLRAGAAWLEPVLAVRASAGAKEELRARLAERFAQRPPDGIGAATVVATRGLDDLDPYFRTVLPAVVSAAVIPLAAGARILSADWLSAIIVVLTVPLVPVFMILIGRHTADRVTAAAGALRRLSDALLELARGLPVLVGLGRVEEQTRALEEVSDAYRRATIRTLRTAFLSALALELIATIAVALVAVTVGIRLLGGDLPLAAGLLVLLLAPECFGPLREVGSAFHASRDGMAAFERVREVLAPAGPAGPAPRPAGPESRPAGPESRPAGPESRLAGDGVLVDGLRVRYPGRRADAVTGLSFTAAAGEIVAVSGASGGGKSTVLAALAGRLDPEALTEGVAAVAGPVAWAPQHPHTVGDTVEDELRRYASGIAEPDRAVERLLDALVLAPLRRRDPAAVSPGELRRIAVARALLRVEAGARVLLLDEPTAHLDRATAAAVEAEILSASRRAAVVVVSHEPALLGLADRVVRVGAGTTAAAPSAEGAAAVPPTRDEPADAPQEGWRGSAVALLGGLLRPVAGRVALGALLGALAAASGAALTAVSAWLIVRAAEQVPIMYLLVAIVGVRFFGLGRAVLRYAERLVTHDAVFASVTRLRTRLWRGLAAAGASSRSAGRGGTALDLLVVTADQVRDLVPRVLQPPIVALVVGAASLAPVALLLPAALPLVAGAVGAAVLLAPALALAADRRARARELALRAEQTRRFAAYLQAVGELAGNGVDGDERVRLRAVDVTAGRQAVRSAAATGAAAALAVLALGGAALGSAAVAAPQVAAGAVPAAAVAVLVLLPLALLDPVLAAVAAVQQAPALAGALRRLGPTLAAAELAPSAGGDPVPRVTRLELDGVSARWPGAARPAFSAAAARLARGDWLGITGPSGSGKSTLLSVLLGWLPVEDGRYLVDGADARRLDARELRRRIAWCPQEGHLFASTLRGNLLLARGRNDAPTDAELAAVLARVRLTGLVASLPDGLDTFIGSEGARLSGGERQRLAVARTLLTRADVVLLDEPTAHLDAETAAGVMRDLRGALAHAAVVLVSHRPADHAGDDAVLELGARRGIGSGEGELGDRRGRRVPHPSGR